MCGRTRTLPRKPSRSSCASCVNWLITFCTGGFHVGKGGPGEILPAKHPPHLVEVAAAACVDPLEGEGSPDRSGPSHQAQ